MRRSSVLSRPPQHALAIAWHGFLHSLNIHQGIKFIMGVVKQFSTQKLKLKNSNSFIIFWLSVAVIYSFKGVYLVRNLDSNLCTDRNSKVSVFAPATVPYLLFNLSEIKGN
jgi:hypothetical protein